MLKANHRLDNVFHRDLTYGTYCKEEIKYTFSNFSFQNENQKMVPSKMHMSAL